MMGFATLYPSYALRLLCEELATVDLRSTNPANSTCEKVRHIVIFHHLKTKMTWLLLVVPMMELNQKRLYAIEHLVRPFRDEKVRTINCDH